MKPTLRLGSIAGIPLGMHWSVLGIMVLVADVLAVVVLPDAAPGHGAGAYWITGGFAAAGLLISIAVHEVAHALVATRNGVGVDRITLWLLGGVSALREDPPTPRIELKVAIVGPLASLALAVTSGAAALAAAWSSAPGLLTAVLAWLATVNALLAVFNLLPGAPLDGGRVLRAVLWRRYGDRARASLVAARTGRTLGAVLMAFGAFEVFLTGTLDGLWLALIGWFIMSAATADARQTEMRRAFGDLRARDVMAGSPVSVPAWQTVEQFAAQSGPAAPHTSYPVLDFGGRPVGVVSLGMLSRVPSGMRASTRIGDVAVPIARVPVVQPDMPLTEILAGPAGGFGRGLVLVLDESRLVGVISPGDLARIVQSARLRHPR